MDTTDPRFWSRQIAKEGITESFLRPSEGQKSGILERGFWPGDRPVFGPHSGRAGLISKVKNFFSGSNSSGSNFGDWLKPWTWGGSSASSSYYRMPSPSLLKNIDLRTRHGGPSTVPRANQGKHIWDLYNFAQKTQKFGNLGETPR